ncbi:hypothetical protein KDH_18910 [Dictyobacter sp. S3.2.2.5]|uniref:Polyketide cyclase n=1 Tax=Dictyobacter halimunensis TaxID=3026934 RepID=A0ABQ6FMV1_9CHLR|nr:hypothetical protein KDH_18910 [Dictyobacter sp. S3.2.2.5]
MPKLRFQTIIQRQPDAIYQALLDLPGYRSWLPSSNLYAETMLTSDPPIRVGSTYVDHGRSSVMQGEVVDLEPSRRLVFRQLTNSRRGGGLEITIRYTLQPVEQGTRVTRELILRARGLFFCAATNPAPSDSFRE